MRILHLCLANFYIDGYGYQENILPRLAKEAGNDVLIIASTETFIDNNSLGYVKPDEYYTEYGVRIVRLPYRSIGNAFLTRKLRYYIGLYKEIESFHPDLIFSHDLSFCSIKDVIKYLKINKQVCFLADSHTAFHNSGRNWLSMNVLHRIIYKRCIKKALPYLKKYFYIGESERLFLINIYNVPESLLEFLPLGGTVFDDESYQSARNEIRLMHHIDDSQWLFIHTGKLDKDKKTVILLKSLIANKALKAKLILLGSIPNDQKTEIMALISKDERIEFIGWKTPDILQKYLCACDLYCQPGSPSATLNAAICCRSAILSRRIPGYNLLDKGNFLWIDSDEDIDKVFNSISKGEIDLIEKKEKSLICAKEILDYKNMERRIREIACEYY